MSIGGIPPAVILVVGCWNSTESRSGETFAAGRVPNVRFCETHNLKMITVANLVRYRLKMEEIFLASAELCKPNSATSRNGELWSLSTYPSNL
jgi:hypothetical protein